MFGQIRRLAIFRDVLRDEKAVGQLSVRHPWCMSRYAAARPYALSLSLAELGGPTGGVVRLPRHIDWGPDYSYDLTDEADLVVMYERVIRDAQTAEDLATFLDAGILRRLWPTLFIPVPARLQWEGRFPELAGGSA